MDSQGVGGAYGAGKAGTAFDPVTYVKKPQVILRLVSLFFAFIEFTCMAAGGKERIAGHEQCVLRDGSGPCGFLVFVGVIACVICIGFLVVDALFDNWSNIQHRKYAVLTDLGVSILWAFLWFLSFIMVTSSWRNTQTKPPYGGGKIGAVIAFSLFSIFSWAGLSVLAFLRYRQGSETAFGPNIDQTMDQPPVNPYPGSGPPVDAYRPPSDINFQQPPFMEQSGLETEKSSQYQPPVY